MLGQGGIEAWSGPDWQAWSGNKRKHNFRASTAASGHWWEVGFNGDPNAGFVSRIIAEVSDQTIYTGRQCDGAHLSLLLVSRSAPLLVKANALTANAMQYRGFIVFSRFGKLNQRRGRMRRG
jgi:hypothetical protein